MAGKRGTESASSGAQKNARVADKPKRKQGGKGRPFEPGNDWRIRPGEVRNPGGRPGGLRRAYAQVLAMSAPASLTSKDETAEAVANYLSQLPRADGEGDAERPVTYAELIAINAAQAAAQGDADARREIRQTTEAQRVQSQEVEDIVEALKDGTLTPADAIEVLGVDNARRLLILAGFTDANAG